MMIKDQLNAQATTDDSEEPQISQIFAKWGNAAVAGFQAVPDLLFKHQTKLGLSVNDMVVLLNILMHWWYPEQKPYPRSTTIAKRMGITVRTVQRSLQRMETLKLLIRTKGPGGSTYLDPSPLVQKLIEYAETDSDYKIRSQKRKMA